MLEPVWQILSRPAPDAVPGFMMRWHGLAPEPRTVPGGERLPSALRRFHRDFGTAEDAFFDCRLMPPGEIVDDGGFLVFHVDEEASHLWAFSTADHDGDDPAVWSRPNEPAREWVAEAPRVSVFLVQMLVTSAALAGSDGAAAASLDPAAAERSLDSLRLLDLPPWPRPGGGTRWYAGDDVVAVSFPNVAPGGGASDLSVTVAARSGDGLRFLERHLAEGWDYYSPRDG